MWYLHGARIFVTDLGNANKAIVARLNPLHYKTINQTFGYESLVTKLQCRIVGWADMNTILDAMENEELVTLSGSLPGSSLANLGNFYINDVQAKVMNTISQTLRPDLACDTLVYDASIELLYDE